MIRLKIGLIILTILISLIFLPFETIYKYLVARLFPGSISIIPFFGFPFHLATLSKRTDLLIIPKHYISQQSGFHLDYHLTLRLFWMRNNDHLSESSSSSSSSITLLTREQVTLEWQIPKELFIDIRRLNNENGSIVWSTLEPVDLESPSQKSKPFTLRALVLISPRSPSSNNHVITLNLNNLMIRYQDPYGKRPSNIVLMPPKISVKGKTLNYNQFSREFEKIKIKNVPIPTIKLEIVECVTMSIVITSTLYLMIAIIKS